MKTLVIKTSLAVAACSLSALALSARAELPKECGGEKEQAAFRTAMHQGEALIKGAFDVMKRDCKRLDEIRSVAEGLSAKEGAGKSPELVCRSQGMRRGIEFALAQIQKGCRA